MFLAMPFNNSRFNSNGYDLGATVLTLEITCFLPLVFRHALEGTEGNIVSVVELLATVSLAVTTERDLSMCTAIPLGYSECEWNGLSLRTGITGEEDVSRLLLHFLLFQQALE